MSDYTGNSTTGLDGGADIPDDGPDGFCMACHGRGGRVSTQDPVGDGVGSETLFDPCPACLGDGKCPWCAWEVDSEGYCPNDDCEWTPETIEQWGYESEDYYEDLPL